MTRTISGKRAPATTGRNVVSPARPASACNTCRRSWRQVTVSCRKRGATVVAADVGRGEQLDQPLQLGELIAGRELAERIWETDATAAELLAHACPLMAEWSGQVRRDGL